MELWADDMLGLVGMKVGFSKTLNDVVARGMIH